MCEFSFVAHLVLLSLHKSGDIKKTPRPKKSCVVKFCHWILNDLAAHEFVKIPLIEAFKTTHNFHIICLLETFSIPQYPKMIKILILMAICC